MHVSDYQSILAYNRYICCVMMNVFLPFYRPGDVTVKAYIGGLKTIYAYEGTVAP